MYDASPTSPLPALSNWAGKSSCLAYIEDHVRGDSSKRPQPKLVDIPESIFTKYIFIPTQKMADVSLIRFSSISMAELLVEVTAFCVKFDIPLVVKIHPDLKGKRDWPEQMELIEGLKSSARRQTGKEVVFRSEASINFLTQHARWAGGGGGGGPLPPRDTPPPPPPPPPSTCSELRCPPPPPTGSSPTALIYTC